MSLTWTAVLVAYGLATGWNFSPLFWWLILPLAVQDAYDSHRT